MSAQPIGRPLVLIIEDEPIQRMMALDFVEEAGFDAIEARDAADAISILETRPDIRIVFADIDMPHGVDGLKVAAAIRDRWPPIELIITSGKRSLKQDDIPARMVFFLKPYQVERVITAMQRLAP